MLPPLQAFKALTNILGHVRIVGSTLRLTATLTSGVFYVVKEPYQQMIAGSGWSGIGHGVLIGSARFVGELGSGLLYVVGQFVEGAALGVRHLAFIDTPIERTLMRRPPTLTHGVVTGVMVLTSDCKAAARSAVLLPRQGWHGGGSLGALRGAACGVSGLLLPVAGVLDMAANTVFGVAAEISALGAQHHRRSSLRGPRRNHVQVRTQFILCFAAAFQQLRYHGCVA